MTEILINDELINACKKDDRKAQKQLYERLSSSMFSVCLRYTADYETARDLLQDGFVRVFTKISDYAGLGSFEGWVRRIMVTTCLEFLRKNDVLKWSEPVEMADLLTSPDHSSAIQQLTASEIHQTISAMPEGYRTVFNLFAIEGYSHEEIAEMLQISPVTSRTQLSRARLYLQKRLQALYVD